MTNPDMLPELSWWKSMGVLGVIFVAVSVRAVVNCCRGTTPPWQYKGADDVKVTNVAPVTNARVLVRARMDFQMGEMRTPPRSDCVNIGCLSSNDLFLHTN